MIGSETLLLRARERVGVVVDGRYEILNLAAQGGMGYVYCARDLTTGPDAPRVALKVLSPEYADAPRFAQEAEILARIDHSGVVRYLGHGALASGEKYLVMEWLVGRDLSARLGEGTLDVESTLAIARGAAAALAAAHARGVVHRDLKPSNLFLVKDDVDNVKLCDFGIARALTRGDATLTTALVGTPAYMAPEQVRGGQIDRRVDVYGLGAVMFRCLVGTPPFGGSHELAVLAKVLLEPSPRLRDLVPHVPPSLESLVARMLAKDPASRPADGAEVLVALSQLTDRDLTPGKFAPPAITSREQRIASVVLCAGGASTDTTMAEGTAARDEALLRRAIVDHGGVLDALAHGAWLVTIPNAQTPIEQTARAARCALAWRRLRPGAPLVVATGKIVLAGERHVGEVIDRAAEALVLATANGGATPVRVDAATAELCAGRFRIEGDGDWRDLIGESDVITPARTLLGKPARCFGREHQLTLLSATLAASISEPRACAALVTAAAGLGKSRIVHELVHAQSGTNVDVMFASGDATRAQSAFAVASQILSRAATSTREVETNASPNDKVAALAARDFSAQDAPRMRELLCEIAGAPVPQELASPALRAARADVSIMADALQECWVEWMRTRTSRNPVLVIVEDLHWADAASLKLLEAAFLALAEKPLFVLFTARPDAPPLSERFRENGLLSVSLGPLSAQASERLVRAALGADVAADVVKSLIARAAGHPFHLEELVRAVAEGRGTDALPDSVLGMVQARLDDLDTHPRRLLRAASVFGERFWAGGAAALLGDDVSANDARALIADLVAHEVVTEERSSKWPGEIELRFRHGLLRDAAYATLDESDRVLAHRRAALWLEEHGEKDPALLGEHHLRGGTNDRALDCFARAAAQALLHNDLEEARRHAARARSLGPDADRDAALVAIEAEIAFWRGDATTAVARAEEAATRLTAGSRAWFDATSVVVAALGQQGKNDEVAVWLDRVARIEPSEESRGAQVVALCRGVTQLVWAHHEADRAPARARLDKVVASTEVDAYQMGWLHRARGESAWVSQGDVDLAIRELDASAAAFERARARRARCLTRTNAASLAGWAGDPTRALMLLEESRTEGERLGAGFLLNYARAVEGLVLAFAGDARAEGVMRAAYAGVRASPRLALVCHLVVGSLALARKDLETAAGAARDGMALVVVPDLRCATIALSARIEIARGNLNAGRALAEEAAQIAGTRRDVELTTGLAELALAEAAARAGEKEKAKATLATIVARITRIASTIASEDGRRAFWRRPFPNAEIMSLANELGVPLV